MFGDPALLLRGTRSYRCSSWDRSGANHDWLDLHPGQTVTLIEEAGPGRVTHFYWTTINASRDYSHYANDDASVAYWYQAEPHQGFSGGVYACNCTLS